MKLIKLLIISVFVVLVGGFGYFAVADIHIARHEAVKDIPHETLREH